MPQTRCKKTKRTKIKSVCQLRGSQDGSIKGHVVFTELTKTMKIEIDLYNLPPGPRGFHIHAKGNLLEGCNSLCAHFNPTNQQHGKLNYSNSHAGDLGNIVVDENGRCNTTINSRFLRNSGKKFNIIGRSVVIHEKEDDLGCGGDDESLITGNAGARIACGVIGIF